MAVSNNANLGFEKQIWDAACVLWGHIPAAEYRKVIVGLIFLRYISSAFDKRYQELVEEGDGFEDDRDAYIEDNIFFVPERLYVFKFAVYDKSLNSCFNCSSGILFAVLSLISLGIGYLFFSRFFRNIDICP